MEGVESSWKANMEGRPQQFARLWRVWSPAGKRIWKDVRSGLLGYGGLESSWKANIEARPQRIARLWGV